jgi:hypothetical protein
MKLNIKKEFPNKAPDDPVVALYAVMCAQDEYIKALEIALVNGSRSLAAEGRQAGKARLKMWKARENALNAMSNYKHEAPDERRHDTAAMEGTGPNSAPGNEASHA